MPLQQRDVTGRDDFLLVEALTFTIEALSRLRVESRPENNITDMKRLLEELVMNPGALASAQQTAQRRLNTLLADGGKAGT